VEWGELAIAAGGTGEYGAGGVAGRRLKATTGWNLYSNYKGTDDFGFSALPGGYYSNHEGIFNLAGDVGYWWTAGSVSYEAYQRSMSRSGDDVFGNPSVKNAGHSVRCVRDD
jgi:uncharacterized protein (TIGR02145 family)